MDRYPEIGERVRVHANQLPPSLKKNDTGVVIDRNGEYIYIELEGTCVVIERYSTEIDSLEKVH